MVRVLTDPAALTQGGAVVDQDAQDGGMVAHGGKPANDSTPLRFNTLTVFFRLC
jgi:hypothetical protein